MNQEKVRIEIKVADKPANITATKDSVSTEIMASPLDVKSAQAVGTAIQYIADHYKPEVFGLCFPMKSVVQFFGLASWYQAELPKNTLSLDAFDPKNIHDPKNPPAIVLSFRILASDTESLAISLLHDVLQILYAIQGEKLENYKFEKAIFTAQCYQALGLDMRDYYLKHWAYDGRQLH